MRKKDYELIANTIRQMWAFDEAQRSAIATMFVVTLEADNPKFDRQKFLTACGIETGVPKVVENCRTHGIKLCDLHGTV